MIKSRWLAIPGALVLCVSTAWVTNAQAPAQGPSYAVYCRGQLETLRSEGGKVVKTPFKWAKEVAVKENPGAGECAWAERAPEGIDSKPGDRGVIVGNLGPFDNLPAGVVVAATPNITGSCGSGTITATAGSSTITLSGGTLTASPAAGSRWFTILWT